MNKISYDNDIKQFLEENPEWRSRPEEGIKMLSIKGFEAFRKWQDKKIIALPK